MSDAQPVRRKPDSIEWLPVVISAAVGIILWFVLPLAEQNGVMVMPAWATLLYHFLGREGVVGVFALAFYVTLCSALVSRVPRVATALAMGGFFALLAGALLWCWQKQWTTGGALLGWVFLCIGALSVPTKTLRKVLLALVYFGGAAGGMVLGAQSGRWGLAGMSFFVGAFGLWVVLGGPPKQTT